MNKNEKGSKLDDFFERYIYIIRERQVFEDGVDDENLIFYQLVIRYFFFYLKFGLQWIVLV